jgi:predicted AAA+ superfamily ATPase
MSAHAPRLASSEGQSRALPFTSPIEHIAAELEWLRLLLHRETLRLKAANLLAADPFRGLYLADEHVDAILRNWNSEQGHTLDPRITEIEETAASLRESIDVQLEQSELAGSPMPISQLAVKFGLSDFECHALIAALAVEIDLRFESLYSWVRNDVTRKSPSVDLVLKLFCETPWQLMEARNSFRSDAPLFAHQLLRPGSDQQERDPSLLARSLRVDERVHDFLLYPEKIEQGAIDARLRSFTSIVKPLRRLTSLHLPSDLTAQLRRAAEMPTDSIWCLYGPEGSGKRSAVEALSSERDRALLAIDLHKLMHSQLPSVTLLHLLLRDAVLFDADILFERAETVTSEHPNSTPLLDALQEMLPSKGIRIYIAAEAKFPNSTRRRIRWHNFEFPIPAVPARVQLWREALEKNRSDITADLDVDLLANRFALTGGAIHRACADAVVTAQIQGTANLPLSSLQIEAAARLQSNHGLRQFAQKVESTASWKSLIVPQHIHRQLLDVCTAERHRHTVYTKWGFDQRLIAGKGLNVLFCGSSGTGKTMSAGILARELGRDLYRVDLSIVVSKYIGETEKQLSLIFREAKTSNAMLFFDEADALFGKRSEVKDAHDRYANVEIAYLLQKMEEYEGIVILATNLRRNMDDAFSRRMHHVVEFPFPDAEHREKIWRSILPPGAPVAGDVNFSFLARQFELAGGSIRNIALAAAFIAAEEGVAIRMEHCVIATALELQKNGKLPSRSEFRDYYDLIRSRV